MHQGKGVVVPQQEQARYRSNRADSTEARRDEMDALVDQAIDQAMDEAIADAKDRTNSVTPDDAAAWLDDIDQAMDEWAATSQIAQAFIDGFVQKGGQ